MNDSAVSCLYISVVTSSIFIRASLGFVRAFRSASSRSRLSALFSLARRVASANCHRFYFFPLRPILNAAHIEKPMIKTDSSPIWRYQRLAEFMARMRISAISIASQTNRLANPPMSAIVEPSNPARHIQRLNFDWRHRASIRGTDRAFIGQAA